MPVQNETQLQRIMRVCNCSEDEAKQILEDDRKVDQGEQMEWDLTEEQHKQAMKLANADTKKTPQAKAPRQRKENPTKAGIVAELATFLTEKSENACENVQITNKERQIAFQIGENCYELTLIQKRKPKT